MGDHNFCRNPDEGAGPWCYNSHGSTPRWEYCEIPQCRTPGNFFSGLFVSANRNNNNVENLIRIIYTVTPQQNTNSIHRDMKLYKHVHLSLRIMVNNSDPIKRYGAGNFVTLYQGLNKPLMVRVIVSTSRQTLSHNDILIR